MAQARFRPMHAGALEALGDERFAGGFDHAGTDEVAVLTEVCLLYTSRCV